jgi:hypothetical protein
MAQFRAEFENWSAVREGACCERNADRFPPDFMFQVDVAEFVGMFANRRRTGIAANAGIHVRDP